MIFDSCFEDLKVKNVMAQKNIDKIRCSAVLDDITIKKCLPNKSSIF